MIGTSLRLAMIGGSLLGGVVLTIAAGQQMKPSAPTIVKPQMIAQTDVPVSMICSKDVAEIHTATVHNPESIERLTPVRLVNERLPTAERMGLVPRQVRVS